MDPLSWIMMLRVTDPPFTNTTSDPRLTYTSTGFETTICSYGTDVPNLKGDHKRYLYGPGSILVAHGDDEHILKNDLFEAVKGYQKLVLESLNPTRRPPAVIEQVRAEEVVVEVEVPVVSSSATVVAEKEAETATEAEEKKEAEEKTEEVEEQVKEKKEEENEEL